MKKRKQRVKIQLKTAGDDLPDGVRRVTLIEPEPLKLEVQDSATPKTCLCAQCRALAASK